MPEFGDRLKHAWNAFMNRDPPSEFKWNDVGAGYSYRPDRIRLSGRNERTIVTSIYNRISSDCSAIKIEHVRLDDNGRYLETIKSGLNYCLTTEANIDQTGRAFIEDIVLSLLDEGVIAIVPTETNINPINTASFDVCQMRVGKIVQWYPKHVRIDLYNDITGLHSELLMPKTAVAIIENPFYAVMNEQNSTLQRLVRKLALLDVVDEQTSAGKLDLIIQLPYAVKNKLREEQAEQRRKDIENQLTNTKYGIAYTDGTERITQLNRPIENNLLKQVEYLTEMLYSQLGISKEILAGTADAKSMLNYNNRIIEPIVSAVVNEMNRKFLSKTARTQRQAIMFFSDPFKLVPIDNIAEIADKFTRNEIMSSNEVRQVVGMKPVDDPMADQLRNKNINTANGQKFASTDEEMQDEPE